MWRNWCHVTRPKPADSAAGWSTRVSSFDSRNGSPFRLPNTRSFGSVRLAGFIWLDHEDGAHDPKLGFSREYWASRSRAFAWATAYSIQFEFGPLSEAS